MSRTRGSLILVSGYWQDGLFVGVVASNSIVGVTQEVRARRELARLRGRGRWPP